MHSRPLTSRLLASEHKAARLVKKGAAARRTPPPFRKHKAKGRDRAQNPLKQARWNLYRGLLQHGYALAFSLVPGGSLLSHKGQRTRSEAGVLIAAVAVTRALAAWQDAIDGLTPNSAGSVGQHLDEAWWELEAHMQQQSVDDVSDCGGGRSAAGAAGAGDRGVPPAEAARRAWRWRERLERAIDGCRSTDDCSAAGLALYEEMERGVHVPLSCGFQAVAEWLAAPLDVRYGHAVETVAWGPSGVALACAGGVRLAAAAAVVTVSLGVLKAGCRGAGESGERSAELTGPAEPARPAGGRPLLRFEPPLPGWKLDAIERLRIGVVDKLIVEFGGEGEGGPADEAGVQAAVATSGQVPEATAAAAEGDELLVSAQPAGGGLVAAEARLPQRRTADGKEYLVEWAGYHLVGLEPAYTWEPASRLSRPRDGGLDRVTFCRLRQELFESMTSNSAVTGGVASGMSAPSRGAGGAVTGGVASGTRGGASTDATPSSPGSGNQPGCRRSARLAAGAGC
eukprot:scaffold2.g7288.t1